LDIKKFHITGIVLSAGLSGRMNSFKPLLKLKNGKTFIHNIVDKLLQVCDEVIIVTGFKSNEIKENLNAIEQKEKIRFVFNKDYKSGMFTSLQVGLAKTNTSWQLYHFVDQPSLPLNFYSDFVKQIDDQVRELIFNCSENKTLRDVAKDKSIEKKYWECDTDLIFEDVDTQNDFINL